MNMPAVDQTSNEAFARDNELGSEYEDFLTCELAEHGITISNYKSRKYQLQHGENKLGVEIKFDNKLEKTGNVYIEIGHNPRLNQEGYTPSGIYRNDRTWLYLIGNYAECFIFGKKFLRRIHKTVEKGTTNGLLSQIRMTNTISGSSQGMLIPRNVAVEFSEKHIRFERIQ